MAYTGLVKKPQKINSLYPFTKMLHNSDPINLLGDFYKLHNNKIISFFFTIPVTYF